MKRLSGGVLALVLLAGCAGAPQRPLWPARELRAAFPADCAGNAAPAGGTAADVVPGGLSLVRHDNRDVLLVAGRSCLWMLDVASGRLEPLPTFGDGIAPTMVDAGSTGLAFGSTLSGTVRTIGTDGAIAFNASGLDRPQGLRLMPGGSVLVAERGTGRILRVGPTDEYRRRTIAEGLEEPTGLVVADATSGYVTERAAGRVTRFRLDRDEKQIVATGLSEPEGIAQLPDGALVVAEAGTRRLVRVDPASGAIEPLTTELMPAPQPQAPADVHAFIDVLAGPAGRLYVSAPALRTVLEVTAPQAAPAP